MKIASIIVLALLYFGLAVLALAVLAILCVLSSIYPLALIGVLLLVICSLAAALKVLEKP